VGVGFRNKVCSVSFLNQAKPNDTFVVGLSWNQPTTFHLDWAHSWLTERGVMDS
jgi:hypothetical protein